MASIERFHFENVSKNIHVYALRDYKQMWAKFSSEEK